MSYGFTMQGNQYRPINTASGNNTYNNYTMGFSSISHRASQPTHKCGHQ